MLDTALQLLESGRSLGVEQMAEAIGAIMQGRCEEDDIARFLTLLHEKGESVEEIAGAAVAMRRAMTPIRTRRSVVIDVVGTGGDSAGTFNISTAATVVTAAAGVAVAKHGNRAVTSRSGASDVLRTLGVNIVADVPCVERCLDELGVCFCFAPLHHQAMKHVAPVRQKLGTPTIFNILGPLVNPASTPYQLVGVGRAHLRPQLAQAIALLGTQRTLVVHGTDGLDEVSLAGATEVSEVTPEGIREFTWTPDDFGLPTAGREAMLVEGPDDSAAMIRGIFAGQRGPARDIVVINAAAALCTAGRDPSPRHCAELAAEAIDCGAAGNLLKRLAETTCNG